MKKKLTYITLVLISCLFLLAGAASGLYRESEIRPLREQVLRLRVLASDDSPAAQQEKLRVRDCILSYLESRLPEQADLADTYELIARNLNELEPMIQNCLMPEKTVCLKLGNSYFPQKSYGALTFPAGTYQAFVVRIGPGQGSNWWCCLYPRLCFRDALRAEVSPQDELELKDKLEEGGFLPLKEPPSIRFYFLNVLADIFHG